LVFGKLFVVQLCTLTSAGVDQQGVW
jgi:hypothetical protein